MAKSTTAEVEQGNLIAFLNPGKKPDNNQPAFRGKITLPGQMSERGFALWAHHSDKAASTVLSGKALDSATGQIDRIASPENGAELAKALEVAQREGSPALALEPHAVVLFKNKSKEENQSRPDYFGYYHPGDGEQLIKLAVWAKTDRNGQALLTGTTQRDQVREQEREAAGPARKVARPKPREPERVLEHEHDYDRV